MTRVRHQAVVRSAAIVDAPRPKVAAVRWLSHEGLVLFVVGLACFGLTVFLCAPGFMARDSGTQLEQARSFEFWDDHPVLMALIWHCTDRVLPGPLGMLIVMVGACWAGLVLFFRALPGRLAWRVAGLVGVGFLPPVFSTYPIILKDALMHGALLIGLGVLMKVRRGSVYRLLAALLALAVAIGIRHNAAAAVWPFIALPLLRSSLLGGKSRLIRLAAASTLGLCISFALALGLGRALAPLAHRTEFWQTVPTFDLAGMSLKTGELLVDRDSPVFARGMGLPELRRLFRTEYGPTIYYCVPFGGKRCVNMFRLTVDRAELAELRANWLRAIREHPLAYLSLRWDLTRAMLTVSAGPKELYYLGGAPHHRLAKDYPPTARTTRVMSFIERHIRWVIYRPWVYVALSGLLLPAAVVRYWRSGDALPLLLLFSGIAYLVSTLIGATSSNYRYTVWTILCAVLTLVALLVAGRSGGTSSAGPQR